MGTAGGVLPAALGAGLTDDLTAAEAPGDAGASGFAAFVRFSGLAGGFTDALEADLETADFAAGLPGTLAAGFWLAFAAGLVAVFGDGLVAVFGDGFAVGLAALEAALTVLETDFAGALGAGLAGTFADDFGFADTVLAFVAAFGAAFAGVRETGLRAAAFAAGFAAGRWEPLEAGAGFFVGMGVSSIVKTALDAPSIPTQGRVTGVGGSQPGCRCSTTTLV